MERTELPLLVVLPDAWAYPLEHLVTEEDKLGEAIEALIEALLEVLLCNVAEEAEGEGLVLEDLIEEYRDIVHALVVGELGVVLSYVYKNLLDYLVDLEICVFGLPCSPLLQTGF